jgi:hypothetical protein
MAGANSIFYGCKLLTTPNPEEDKDLQLFLLAAGGETHVRGGHHDARDGDSANKIESVDIVVIRPLWPGRTRFSMAANC